MLGLCCSVWVFSSCSECGLLFIAVHGLFIAVAYLTQLLCSPGLLLPGMWNLPGPGIELMSPALAERFLTIDWTTGEVFGEF